MLAAWWRVISAMVSFLLVTGAGIAWINFSNAEREKEHRLVLAEVANLQARGIERHLGRLLSASEILAFEVERRRGVPEDFEQFAEQILKGLPGITNLQLAPGGIVKRIYPLAGNEKALGHNILRDDARRSEAHMAIASRRLTMAGPFSLVQGGVAIIGRKPIFIQNEHTDEFWGFASVLILLQDLLHETELPRIEQDQYQYELHRLHPDSGLKEVFSQSTAPLLAVRQQASIAVPNAQWTITVSRGQPDLLPYTPSVILASMFGALVAWLVYRALLQPHTLRLRVQEQTEELRALAYFDPVTGLANRNQLNDDLSRITDAVMRRGGSAILMSIDLDLFKRVNDTLGHASGDLVLRQVAARLQQTVSAPDISARLGGDEFAVILAVPDSVVRTANIAKQLIHTIEQPILIQGHSFTISASIGIVEIPKHGDTASELLRHADMAMYAAKQQGRGRYRFFDTALQKQTMAQRDLEERMQFAIERKEFTIHYQPIVEATTGATISWEALLRWQPEPGVVISPDQFIPVAEDTGRIIELGYWVFENVCNMLATEPPACFAGTSVAINLSTAQFRDPRLFDKFRDILDKTGASPEQLEIEVTESLLMDDAPRSIALLEKFRAFGFSIALDDFGTGFSSFALLKQLPVNKIKIDRSFIQDLETDLDDKSIVNGIVAMAQQLGLTVVAEGIENAEQWKYLQDIGCQLVQGFYFQRPLALQDLNCQSELIFQRKTG